MTEASSAARLRRGLGGHGFSLGVTVAVQVASVPLFLHFWGAPLYGEWLVLVALASWFALADLGFVTACTHEVTMRAADRDFDAACGVFQSVWAFVTAASLALAAMLALGASAAPLAAWFDFAGLDDADAGAVVLLLLGCAVVHLQTQLVSAGLVGAGQYGLQAFLLAVTRLGAFAAVALALALGGGPRSAAAAMAAVECAGFALVVVFVRRWSPWLRYGLAGASGATLRRLAAPAIGFAGQTAGNALGIQGPILVVGAVLGPGAVAVFSALRMLARAPVMLSNVVFATLRPEISIAYGRRENARVRGMNERAVQLALWFATAAFAGLALLGPWIVDAWTGGKIAVRQPLFVLLLAVGLATQLWTGAACALHATNHNKEIAVIHLVVAGAALAVSAVAGTHAGVDGIAAVLAVAELAVFALVLRRALAFLDQPFLDFARAVVRPPSGAIALLRGGNQTP